MDTNQTLLKHAASLSRMVAAEEMDETDAVAELTQHWRLTETGARDMLRPTYAR